MHTADAGFKGRGESDRPRHQPPPRRLVCLSSQPAVLTAALAMLPTAATPRQKQNRDSACEHWSSATAPPGTPLSSECRSVNGCTANGTTKSIRTARQTAGKQPCSLVRRATLLVRSSVASSACEEECAAWQTRCDRDLPPSIPRRTMTATSQRRLQDKQADTARLRRSHSLRDSCNRISILNPP